MITVNTVIIMNYNLTTDKITTYYSIPFASHCLFTIFVAFFIV